MNIREQFKAFANILQKNIGSTYFYWRGNKILYDIKGKSYVITLKPKDIKELDELIQKFT